MLEGLLSRMTAKPACIDSRACSIDPPVPFQEDLFDVLEAAGLLRQNDLHGRRLKWSLDERDSEEQGPGNWFQEIESNQ
jgi:hypothetical protein